VKAHLLFRDRDFDVEAELPDDHEDLEKDLEIGILLGAMAAGDRFIYGISQRVLHASLVDPDAIRYRQDIIADCIAHPEVIRSLYALIDAALKDRKGFWGFRSSPRTILYGSIESLGAFAGRLGQLRRMVDDHVGELRSEGLRMFAATVQQEIDDSYLQLMRDHLRQLHFRDGYLLSERLDRDGSGVDIVLRYPLGSKTGWKERLGIGARTSYSFNVAPRDEAGNQQLDELVERGINSVANAVAQSADHIESFFTMVERELGFYVGCLNLWESLSSAGMPIVFPDPCETEPFRFSCTELGDVSLALKSGGHVVGNDVTADGRPLVIVTGANSGGKSTFLRSVGLAQLMMQSGMFVLGKSYRASVSTRVLTHFIREEDRTMRSGRLDEELSRMDAVANKLRKRCLVLFNESFAATNEREGSEIGRQVVQALLERDVRVFFVTHRFELADGFRRSQPASTRFLRAERTPDGRRTFKLVVADPLPTSYGEDVYHRLGGWLGEEGKEANEAGNLSSTTG
jgi:hypothetical protein